MLPIRTLLTYAFFVTSFHANAIPINDHEIDKRSSETPTKYQQRLEKSLSSFTVNFGKILKQNSPPEENILFSPLNLYSALLLLHLGANGVTQSEMSTALQVSVAKRPKPSEKEALKPQKKFHQHFSSVLKQIQNSRTADIKTGAGIFLQHGFPIKEEYSQAIKSLYDGEIANLDFEKESEQAQKTINRWISNKTNDRIPQLFTDPLPADTLALLVSTLYYSAEWEHTFAKTEEEKFKSKTAETTVQMMNNQEWIPYSSNQKLQVETIAVPYLGYEFSMYVVLPHLNNTLDNFIANLTPKDLQQLIEEATTEEHYVNYKIPRMKFNWGKDVVTDLSALGIKSLFENADLSNMTSANNLKVSEVTHATEIEINENGTVASAATAVRIELRMGREGSDKVIKFVANRPFMFLIVHKETNVILFSGLVYKP